MERCRREQEALVLFGPTNGTHIGLSGSGPSRRTTRTGSAADSDGGGFSSQLGEWQEPCEEWLRSMNIAAKTLQILLAIGVVLRKLTRTSVLCDVLRIETRW